MESSYKLVRTVWDIQNYTNALGEKKSKYYEVGAIFSNGQNSFMKLRILGQDVIYNIFEPKPTQQEPVKQEPAKVEAVSAMFSDEDAPF